MLTFYDFSVLPRVFIMKPDRSRSQYLILCENFMKDCAHAKILSTKVIFSDFWNATLVADIYEHVHTLLRFSVLIEFSV